MKRRGIAGTLAVIMMMVYMCMPVFAADKSVIDTIPIGNYSSVGYNGDTVDYRVDGWMYSWQTGELILDFGHYEKTGSMYSLYDKTNPNGDSVILYEEDGKLYAYSMISEDTYKASFDGKKLTIYWKNVTWNSGKNIVLEYKDSKSTDTNKNNNTNSGSTNPFSDDEVDPFDVYVDGVG